MIIIGKILFAIVVCLVTDGYAECDDPDAPEKSRIYFANGMSNSTDDAWQSRQVLLGALGAQNFDFGIAYNDNENWFRQLMEVHQQRQNESDEFWYWLRHMDQAPQWFRDEYVQKVGRFNESMVRNDPDLQDHIRRYLASLVSGKKVVIVAHSQGNFYANNACRFIKINYPAYKNSIGVVSVATPATFVEGGGSYSLNSVYTTNPEDLIINLVRGIYPDTLPANVPPYNNPNSMTDHGFIDTYFSPDGYRSRIISQILQRIATLETPKKSDECIDPDEVAVIVKTTTAANVSATSASLRGYVQSGKQIAGHCAWRRAADGPPSSCLSIRNNIATSGGLDSGEYFSCTATGLTPGTDYKYRVCGREGDRISDGGIQSFRTGGAQCGQTASYNGGSEGLTVTYAMGSDAGSSSVDFEAFDIPDKLEIWQGSKLLYVTKACGTFSCIPSYVSGHHATTIYHNPYYGETWQIKVYGNSNTNTKWEVKVSCPE